MGKTKRGHEDAYKSAYQPFVRQDIGGMYYFAYGSNTNTKQMGRRCPAAYPVRTGWLEDYALEFRSNMNGRGVCNLIYRKGAKVWGTIWNVTQSCIAELDRYEGFPLTYTRVKARVHCEGVEQTIKAVTYIMNPNRYSYLTPPTKKYFDKCADGYEDGGLPFYQLEEALDEALEEEIRYEEYVQSRELMNT